jgi:hypothetical protein
LAELEVTLKKILSGELGPADGDDRKQLIEQYLAAQTGPLACERMVDALEKIADIQAQKPKSGLGSRLVGLSLWAARTSVKRYKDSRSGSHNRPDFQRHRYPEVPLEDVQSRVDQFTKLLNISEDLKVEQALGKFFRIRA